LTYWPWRVARGGRVLAPGRPDRRIQFLDVRDLAAWMLTMAERQASGTFNAVGPGGRCTMGALLHTCEVVTGSGARFAWAPDGFLLAQGVEQWTEMPLWVAESPEQIGFMEMDGGAAIAQGMMCRPVADTVRDTWTWHATREPYAWTRTGITGERERELLAALDTWTA
jgi:2'-hydroxyisoflavone reductase